MVGLTPLQTMLEMKFYFAHYVEGFVLLGKISLFLLIFINVNFFWGVGGGVRKLPMVIPNQMII